MTFFKRSTLEFSLDASPHVELVDIQRGASWHSWLLCQQESSLILFNVEEITLLLKQLCFGPYGHLKIIIAVSLETQMPMVRVSGSAALIRIKGCQRASLLSKSLNKTSALVVSHSFCAFLLTNFGWLAQGEAAATGCQDLVASLLTDWLNFCQALLRGQSFNMRVLDLFKREVYPQSNKLWLLLTTLVELLLGLATNYFLRLGRFLGHIFRSIKNHRKSWL